MVRGWVVIVGLVGRVMSGGSTAGTVDVGVDVEDDVTDVGTLVDVGGEPICWAPGIKL